MFGLKIGVIFIHLEVVGCGSETQIQVGEYLALVFDTYRAWG